MAFDTKYRPTKYADVLGQETTVQVLRNYIKKGAGFHQSYLFAGPWGSGKTTLGRIHARALMCAAPVEGEACDACLSCRSMLGGSSDTFVEIDAATNSSKESVKRILEEIQFASFSGRHKLYLFDESHRLSSDALDALLKPMEDCVAGTEDKSLVCIFCTTEPERMRATILSRCAPAFVIRPVSPVQIGARLAQVCETEGLAFELEALELIGELTECHIRDALKAIEGVSNLGTIDRTNVAAYLHLDVYTRALDVLELIVSDLPKALEVTEELLTGSSPTTVYERLVRMAMLSYRAGIGPIAVPSYLDRERVKAIGSSLGMKLLTYANRFAMRPGRPTGAMLLCDVAQLNVEANAPQMVAMPMGTISPNVSSSSTLKPDEKTSVKSDEKPATVDGVYLHPRAVKVTDSTTSAKANTPPPVYQPLEFFKLVRARVRELETEKRGRSGQDNLGSSGANQDGGSESN